MKPSTHPLPLDSNNFTFGFQRLGTTELNNSYLGIWFNSDATKPFWLANRDQPIADNSGVLSIDGSGNLRLNYSGGNLIEFYSSQSSGSNLAAVLEESGDFVLRDANSGNGQALWESFGAPTDSFLPGMKLGHDHKTGKNWSLTSWLSDSIPSSGAFTLEWNSTGQQLVVKRRGGTFWAWSGDTEVLDPGTGMLHFSFTNVSNGDEDYFMYTVSPSQYSSPDQKNFTLWRLGYDGSILDQESSRYILSPSTCDGNNTDNGCVRWEGPKCRNNGDKFDLRSGWFVNTVPTIEDNNSSLSISDCKDLCWKNCSCVGTVSANSNGTGCVFW